MTDLDSYALMIIDAHADVSYYENHRDENNEVWRAIIHHDKNGRDIAACFYPDGKLKSIDTVDWSKIE